MARRAAHRLSRSLKQARKSMAIGLSLAGNAQLASALGAASAATIAQRGKLMADAIGHPFAWANPEFTRMATEKVMAAAVNGPKMMVGAFDMYRLWLNFCQVQVQRSLAVSASVMTSTTPAGAAAKLRAAAERGVADATDAVQAITQVGQKVSGAGMKRVHRVAAGNAGRLARSALRRP